MALPNIFPTRCQIRPAFIFLLGALAGQHSDSIGRSIRWCHQHADNVIIPGYTILAVLYLSLVAFESKHPLLRHIYYRIIGHMTARKGIAAAKVSTPDETTAIEIATSAASQEPQPIDFTGAYKLISNVGFEKFLEMQGIPWALRRAANQARPVHRITHQGARLTIRIEGIIESQTTYIIGGPPVETNVRGRIFQDVVTYVQKEGVTTGIICKKTAVTEDYDVTVQRELSPDKQEIHMISTVYFRDGRDPIESRQVFQRLE